MMMWCDWQVMSTLMQYAQGSTNPVRRRTYCRSNVAKLLLPLRVARVAMLFSLRSRSARKFCTQELFRAFFLFVVSSFHLFWIPKKGCWVISEKYNAQQVRHAALLCWCAPLVIKTAVKDCLEEFVSSPQGTVLSYKRKNIRQSKCAMLLRSVDVRRLSKRLQWQIAWRGP